MPLYDYECTCGVKEERFSKPDKKESCPECGKEMKRLISGRIGINMGVGAYGYYDDTLQTDITTNAQRREVMKKQGVSESYGKGWI